MRHVHHSQLGIALILFLTIFVLGAVAILLSTLNQGKFALEDDAQTARALAQAKEALIGYALTFYETSPGNYGFLPCPDLDASTAWAEGISPGNACGSRDISKLGRLPWATLGIPALRDGAGECLWYAVAGPYKNASSARTKMLNEDTNGLFRIFVSDGTATNGTTATEQLTGTSPKNRAVAVIIAPGKILPGQNRTPLASGVDICGGNYTASNYLETDVSQFDDLTNTANKEKEFLTAQDVSAQDSSKSHPINDKVIYITREELFAAIRSRTDFYDIMKCLTQIAAYCVATYAKTNPNFTTGDKRLPWPAPVTLADYSDETQYNDQGTLLTGRLPNKVDNSNSQIGAAKTSPQYLLLAPSSGGTECNFKAINYADLTDCGTNLKAITGCNPNATTDFKEVIWCNALDVPVAERDPPFEYSFIYSASTNYEHRISCALENADGTPFLTPQQKTVCQQITQSNSAFNLFETLWNNWKDHLFYAVADAYKPTAPVTSPTPACDDSNCLKKGTTNCAAVVIFAGTQWPEQTRDAPPPSTDSDTKKSLSNYLEGSNATNVGGTGTYQQLDMSNHINDILYCIK